MRALTLSSIALLAFTAPLAGQSQAEACATLGTLTVGQWSSYRVTGADMPGGVSEMTMSIVDSEELDGVEHYWFEIQAGTQMGNMVMQVLIPGYPYEPADVRSAVIKMGNQPAMRMPQQMLARMGDQNGGGPTDDFVAECNGAELVGRESVTVPAGTMNALHLLVPGDDGGDAWISTEIGFGIVKFNGPGFEMELTAHGMDATSAITEEPQNMPGT